MKILTANRLTDGEAVWFSAAGVWAESIEGADIVGDKDGEARLEAIGKRGLDQNEVVDVNLIDINVIDGLIQPLRLREVIRAAGPTNRLDLGKQARPAAAVA